MIRFRRNGYGGWYIVKLWLRKINIPVKMDQYNTIFYGLNTQLLCMWSIMPKSYERVIEQHLID